MLTSKKKYFILLNIIIWMFFGIVVLMGAMPRTPLMLNKSVKKKISKIYPNRWSFFTKNPKEEYIYILKKDGKDYLFHKNFPNSSLSNVFGLINYQKAVGLEYGIITGQIDEDLWNVNENGDNLFEILKKDSLQSLSIKKTKDISKLSGEFVFVKIEPLPYLWRNKVNQFDMPCKFVKIIIQ